MLKLLIKKLICFTCSGKGWVVRPQIACYACKGKGYFEAQVQHD